MELHEAAVLAARASTAADGSDERASMIAFCRDPVLALTSTYKVSVSACVSRCT